MLVVFGLVFFHAARIFDTLPWYVKNYPTSELFTVAVGFAALWGMPLMFVIAGMGIWFSLRSRSTKTFSIERVRRLLVPLVFGVLVIVPPMVWTNLRANPAYDESFWQFLGRFFDFRFDLTNFPLLVRDDAGLFQLGNLWFLLVLLVFTLLLLPVIWCLRRPHGLRVIDWLADKSKHLWLIAAAGLPFSVLDAAFGTEAGLGGWSRYSYAVFLLYGYLLATDRRFGQALHKHRKSALVLGSLTFIVVGVLFKLGLDRAGVDPLIDHDFSSLAMRLTKGVSGWLWVVAILGFAAGFRSGTRASQKVAAGPTVLDRFARYAGEAVLPFYVLHQIVTVLIGFYIVDWPVGAVPKYLLICLLSLAAILTIYEVFVRRARVTRFLFGMRLRR